MRSTLLITALLAASQALAAPAPTPTPLRPAAAPPAGATGNIVADVRARFGVEITREAPQPEYPQLRIKPLTAASPNESRFARLCGEELGRYPPAMLRATGLKTVALVEDAIDGGEVASIVRDSRTMFVSIRSESDDDYLRHLVHHTLAYSIDRRLNGQMAELDPRWLTLNAPSFRYGGGGAKLRVGYDPDHSDASPGFCSLYARAGAMEDKADMFAMLMVPRDAAWLRTQADRDPILAAKMKYTQSIIDHFNSLQDNEEQQRVEKLFDMVTTSEPRQPVKQQMDEQQAMMESSRDIINEKTWAGRTPMLIAAMQNQHNLPGVLILRAQPDVTIADEDGFTPLHAAAFLGNHLLARRLLEAGADPKAKDRFGGTPMDWAKQRNNQNVVTELMRFRPQPRPQPRPAANQPPVR